MDEAEQMVQYQPKEQEQVENFHGWSIEYSL